MGDRDLIISQIRQRLEILYQMVEELENQPSPGPGPGTSDYDDLSNKPSINNVELKGNKTAAQLGLATSSGLSSITSRFEDLITPDNISIEDNGQLPSSIDSRLALHQPIMLNHVIYYCEDESGVGYTYVALDTSGAYPKFSYAQIFKDNKRVHFYDFATDTVPASDSDNFITSGGVYSAIQDLATVARTGSYTDLINTPTIPDVSDYYTKTETDAEISDAIGDLSLVARTGDYDDLENKPTIPAAQVNSDWNAASGVAQILNKPTLGAAAAKGVDSSPTPSSTNLVESGGVSAALNGKQNSLTTAQLNAVSSGITSAKVSQYDTDSAATAELVDNGAKNLSTFNSGVAGTDNYVLASGVPLDKAGETLVFSYKSTTNAGLITIGFKDVNGGSTGSAEIENSGSKVKEITIPDNTVKFNIFVSKAGTYSDFMICTAADWAVSQKFVPYCPSMAELYAMIKALQT